MIPEGPYSVQRTIHQAGLVLAAGRSLLDELRNEEHVIKDEVREVISWGASILVILGFLTGGLIFFFFPGLLPRAETLMEGGERVRQSQVRLIEFQGQAIEALDSHRDNVLGAISELRSVLVHGRLLPHQQQLPLWMEAELCGQAELIISSLETRYRTLPEETRRLRRIEAGLREGQGMDDRQMLELVGRYAEEERRVVVANQAAGLDEEAWDDCPCIIL